MGAAKHTESRRSSMPPWPSIMWPQSLMPRSRLIADMTIPPAKPSRLISTAINSDCQKVKGVMKHKKPPIKDARATPPTKPSTVFDGDRLGAILRLPKSLPHTYCSTSDSCTTITR
ncbi:hypothetical protein D3C87_1800520 [compost metagenome]